MVSYEGLASLGSIHNHEHLPGISPSSSNSRPKDGVPVSSRNYVNTLHAYQNDRKRQLASLDRLHNHAIWHLTSIWHWRSNANSKVMVVSNANSKVIVVYLYLPSLPRKTSYRLRPSWYACCVNFGTISGIPSFELEVDLEGQIPRKSSWLCNVYATQGG